MGRTEQIKNLDEVPYTEGPTGETNHEHVKIKAVSSYPRWLVNPCVRSTEGSITRKLGTKSRYILRLLDQSDLISEDIPEYAAYTLMYLENAE